ncbi:MAG: hypothetical protein NVS2B7_40560 [Herpetosiphon sp.]
MGIFLALLLLQLPTILVLAHPGEIPSASRSLAIAPLAYVLVAVGLSSIVKRAGYPRMLRLGMGAALLLTIGWLNYERYFVAYAHGLPDRNVAMGGIIADYLDQLPAGTEMIMVECCWGGAGQPEPKGIQYLRPHSNVMRYMVEKDVSCSLLEATGHARVLVWNPRIELPAPSLAACASLLRPEVHVTDAGLQIFQSSVLP